MIPVRIIKDFAKTECNKRISKKAIDKIDKILEKQLYFVIKQAIRNADFAGRNTVKEGDIAD